MLTQAAAPRFHLPSLPSPSISDHKIAPVNAFSNRKSQRFDSGRSRISSFKLCRARRRVRYEEDHNGEEDDEGESYGHNAEIAMLESYTDSTPSVVLLIRATVEGQAEEVLVYKGFSSCLSSRTVTDSAKSVLPAKAIIQSIDIIKGPFDPSSIEYLEKGLTWAKFRARLQSN